MAEVRQTAAETEEELSLFQAFTDSNALSSFVSPRRTYAMLVAALQDRIGKWLQVVPNNNSAAGEVVTTTTEQWIMPGLKRAETEDNYYASVSKAPHKKIRGCICCTFNTSCTYRQSDPSSLLRGESKMEKNPKCAQQFIIRQDHRTRLDIKMSKRQSRFWPHCNL
jgi:hypothetical protein